MKAILINLGIIGALIAMYYLNFWELFTSDYAFIFGLLLVIIMLLVGIKVLGNPFGKRK